MNDHQVLGDNPTLPEYKAQASTLSFMVLLKLLFIGSFFVFKKEIIYK